MTAILALDYASAFVFALTGALVASRGQLDIIGFFFFACLTAVGGGTLRDTILDREEVFWVADPTPLAIACMGALIVFFTAHLLESRLRHRGVVELQLDKELHRKSGHLHFFFYCPVSVRFQPLVPPFIRHSLTLIIRNFITASFNSWPLCAQRDRI